MKQLRNPFRPRPVNAYESLLYQFHRELKHFKRKKALFKAKIFLTLILPAVILLLAQKVIRTWLHLRLKGISLPSEQPKAAPVKQETMKTEFITPTPAASAESISESSAEA